jgi:hypothetical protein
MHEAEIETTPEGQVPELGGGSGSWCPTVNSKPTARRFAAAQRLAPAGPALDNCRQMVRIREGSPARAALLNRAGEGPASTRDQRRAL